METAERGGRRMAHVPHRETDRDRLQRNADAIFDLHASALAWLEDYTGIPFPFEKFDFVLVPAFQYGGMEHPGAIFYHEHALLLDESATQNAQLGRASLIAHETAHMWFGDLVTMEWFDDVWMKETFANFMAARIVNPAFPEVDHGPAVPAGALPGGVRGRPDGRRQRDPAAARQPERGGDAVRPDHLPEGADRLHPPRAPDRRGGAARGIARVPERRMPTATPAGPI